ncbi:MAG: hypothetical protein ACRD2T_14265 [Thermoanaerobaculia bacterium]
MNARRNLLLLLLLPLALLAACRARTDRSEGTVVLTISDFDGLPVVVSATAGPFSIEEVELRNVAKDPTGNTSDLQDIEIRSYEVRYTRLDTGTRVPPPLVEAVFGNVQVNSTTLYENLPFMRANQIFNPPISDLADFGRDRETNSTVIPLNVTMRFFGRTLSGDDIASAPASFTIDVVP